MSNESGNKPVAHKKHIARQQREQQQTRLILYVFVSILGAVILLLGYGWLDVAYFQANKPVAKVGDVEILVRDFEPRVRLQRDNLISQFYTFQQYAQFGMDVNAQLQEIQGQLDNPALVGQTVLNRMIDEELIRQEAAKRGITASEEEIQEAIQGAFAYYPNGTPSPTITPTQLVAPELPAEALKIITPTSQASATPEATFTSTVAVEAVVGDGTSTVEPTASPTLTATVAPIATATTGPTSTPSPTATPYTEEGFNNVLSEVDTNLAKFGFNEAYYRSFFEVEILERKLREQITADVALTETQVWARHILVADEQTAKDIIARVQAGEDFAELAKEFSSDGSAAQGGDLGWFGKGRMVPEFETAAFALENSGDITTTPVQSQFGFHIIQLVAKQDRPLDASAVKTAKDTAFQEWLTTAREEYGVETFDVWQSRVPTEPNFVSVATEQAIAQQTSQAEQLATFQAVTITPIP